MSPSSSFVRMPDSSLVLITLDQAEPFNSFHFQHFGRTGELIGEGSSSLSGLVPEGPIHATAVGNTAIGLTITASVTPPTGNGHDILLRVFNLDFEVIGTQLFVSPGEDSVAAICSIGADHVAITGEMYGPDRQAFVLRMSEDGLVNWLWQDTLSSHLTSSGLDLIARPFGNLASLIHYSTGIEEKAWLVEFDGNGTAQGVFIDPDQNFPYNRGSMISGQDHTVIYYCGNDPGDPWALYALGMYDFSESNGWQFAGETPAVNISLLWPFDLQYIADVLVVSDGFDAGWAIPFNVPENGPPEEERESIALGGNAVLDTPTGGAIILGEQISRIHRWGYTYYWLDLEAEAVDGVRMDDTTFVALQRLETSPGNFTHTLQWYTEHFVNVPPSPPLPLWPEDGAVLDIFEHYNEAIRWVPAIDPDPDSEVTTYLMLQVQRFERPDTLVTLIPEESSSYLIHDLDQVSDVPLEDIQGAMWRVRAISDGDTVEMDEPWSFTLQSTSVNEITLPETFSLELYPNPFNSTVQVSFTLAHPARLHFSLVNLLGREVLALPLAPYSPGVHSLNLNPGLTSGVYLLSVKDNRGHFLASRRAILIQ